MRSSRPRASAGPRQLHRHAWLWEPLAEESTFVLRSMFGAKAVYLGGRLMLCFCANAEPWCGLLVCTERAHHASLIAEFPSLAPHPVLPKWLYLSEASNDFERTAAQLVQLARRLDPRLGVVPQPRARSKTRRRRQPRP